MCACACVCVDKLALLQSAFTAETSAAWSLVSGQRCGRGGRELSEPRTPDDPETLKRNDAFRSAGRFQKTATSSGVGGPAAGF